jgi:hypothetical protein
MSGHLRECNKCREAGFPNTMFFWKDDPSGKTRPDGSPWGNQTNPDDTPHTHKTRQATEQVQKKLTSIGADIKEDTYKGATAQLSDISLQLDRIEKQNNTIIDLLAERNIGDE